MGGLSPGHGECGTASPYRGLGEAPSEDAPGEESGGKTPEAESSVAFEAPAEEPNLTLVVDLFLPRDAL